MYVQRAYEQQKQQEEARSGGGVPGGFGGGPGGGFGGGAGGGIPGGFGGGAGGGFSGAGGTQPDMSKLFKVRLQGLKWTYDMHVNYGSLSCWRHSFWLECQYSGTKADTFSERPVSHSARMQSPAERPL
jgi:hypothetical protein